MVATSPSSDTGQRDQGTVKWFNVSKGFGFIVKEDGEEIFVHFRSIRGEGRRSLRDGEAVNFITTDSEKGPQAEDVVAER
ncbi:cold-shock protein [Candidatus Marimicrobium litorale]|uniref:cold-shock protein n=1 Tax=Candidatus Marimicrobium litorale TaxID=2518991 RepID=UPI00242ACCCF|nr:cold shock domain-containing protein [Candidatus Marimicrobium litorale]